MAHKAINEAKKNFLYKPNKETKMKLPNVRKQWKVKEMAQQLKNL